MSHINMKDPNTFSVFHAPFLSFVLLLILRPSPPSALLLLLFLIFLILVMLLDKDCAKR